MIQNILAILAVVGTLLYVLWQTYRIYFSKKRKQNECCKSCPSITICKLKDLKSAADKKTEGCQEQERL